MPLPFMASLAIFAGLKAVGTGLGVIGQRKQARGIEREGEMERELFGKNAELAEEQALDAVARGRESEMRHILGERQLTGLQRSTFAGSNVRLGVGSVTDVMASDRRIGHYDRLMIRENAAREAMGFRKEAEIYRSRGDLAYTAARNRAKNVRYESIGTLANFAGDMWGLYKGIS